MSAFLLQGCVIICPHFRKSWAPIDGLVVVKATNEPIANAEVTAHYSHSTNEVVKTHTAKDGKFHLGQQYEFRLGFLLGPTDDSWRRDIVVKAPGYLELTANLWPISNSKDRTDVSFEDDILVFRLTPVSEKVPEQTSSE